MVGQRVKMQEGKEGGAQRETLAQVRNGHAGRAVTPDQQPTTVHRAGVRHAAGGQGGRKEGRGGGELTGWEVRRAVWAAA